ncbi:MipA/OmpV family protein [Glaciecola sp. 1036]|uniref:MipA/OmpV family protein n=1 Tax=Alteromonadaceae TaxID=72275 RepID=UPI003D039DFB
MFHSYPTFTNNANESNEPPDRDITGFEAGDELQPLWEFGVAGGVGDTPNYPASSERNFIALAAPYFVYRGEILRIGDGGVRAVVVDDERWELDFSFGGAFNADSEDDSVRAGMPELDYLFEVGPLFERKNTLQFGAGFVWRIYTSDQKTTY